MREPLSGSLQASIRFFSHPLPSKGLCLRCLRPTRSNRPLLDLVGFTLLYRIVVCSSLGAVYPAVVFCSHGEESP